MTVPDVAADDIDALLDEVVADEPLADDIDALLAQAQGTSSVGEPEPEGEQFETEEEQLAAIMANIGEDTEPGDPDLKKDEAESVAAAVDSATAAQESTTTPAKTSELEKEEGQLAASMADIENDQLNQQSRRTRIRT